MQLGLSNFTAFEVAECVMHCKYNNWVRPTVFQGMYNAIQRGIESELIPTCRRYGIDVVSKRRVGRVDCDLRLYVAIV